MSDDELGLLDRWCAGDTAAGNLLFKRHFASVYRFFEHKVDRPSDADELVQDTFLACVRSRDAFLRRSSFRTYLFAIARNALYAHWQKRSGRDALDVDEISIASLSTSVGSQIARREDGRRLVAALRELPLDLQLLLELHYWEGFEGEQLAEIFEVEPPTTRSRMFRARQLLREHLLATGDPTRAATDDALDAWARALAADDPDEP